MLQGIAWCGQCGHKMAVQYKNANNYVCNYLLRSQGGSLSQHFPADLIDARVVEAFLAAIGPAELETWALANHARQQTCDAANRAEAQQVERLRYEAFLAERQYNRVDPDNRLIAAELERRWETALRDLRQAEDAFARRPAEPCKPEALSDEEHMTFLRSVPGYRKSGCDRKSIASARRPCCVP
ncbi:zinc ribbon domain-containing protein [Paraburkholderia sediminicola]|nr:zinc ribbon domain-containing protein [Paraburkholderia sediminicola]